MDPFVEQISQLCRAYPLRSKWVFVPTHAIGRTLGDRLALEGTNWLNLRLVTPLDIALRMGAPFLVERRIEPSEEGLGPALMMRLLLNRPPDSGYFRPLVDQPTMADALWRTLRELRMAGIRSQSLASIRFAPSAKQEELVALLLAYEQFLEQNQRTDRSGVYEEALRHPDWCPLQPEECLTELPNVSWSPLERSLIDSMPGERFAPRALDLPGTTVPRRLISRKVELLAPEPKADPLAFLMAPTVASAESELKIKFFHAGGREAEIDEVFRRILATGAPLDQVEIACASDNHAALIWEKALRYNWQITLSGGIPVAFTRPGRALIGFCDWIETDFSASHFCRLLQSGDLKVKEAALGFSAAQAARLLRRAEAGWGRKAYDLALARLERSYESRAADDNVSQDDRAKAREKAALTSRLRGWITALIKSVPEPDVNGKIPLQAVVSGALAFLEATAECASAIDARALAALAEQIRELRALGAFSCSMSEALRFISERVGASRIASERARPGHLFVCNLALCGYSGRAHLFVVGLEEGRVFPAANEDAVLLDDERQKISPQLRLSTDKVDEAVFAVLTRLASIGRHVTFSYSCRDTREFRETHASWLMLQAFRLSKGNGELAYRQMKDTLEEPRSAVPSDRESALGEGDWWLRSVVGSGESGIAVLEPSFPTVVRGATAERWRNSCEFTEFDGYVPAAGTTLDPCAIGAVFSVTELESAATCPFRFFLKRGLGLQPVDGHERDKDIWLDPLMRGSELHSLYAVLLRRARGENRRPTADDASWLLPLAQERLKKINEEMPAATAELLQRESVDFLADLQLFLEAEIAESNSTAVGLEVPFGRPLEDENVEPLASPEAVAVELGEGITFRFAGRIDRIDKVGKASFEVVDYKTGGFWRDNWKGSFNGGRRLQHALYGLAATQLLKARYKQPEVRASVYYFPTHKGRRERVRISAPPQAAINQVLRDLRDVITSGEFIRAPKDNCRFCDYTAACNADGNNQAAEKRADPKLAAYGRLSAHE